MVGGTEGTNIIDDDGLVGEDVVELCRHYNYVSRGCEKRKQMLGQRVHNNCDQIWTRTLSPRPCYGSLLVNLESPLPALAIRKSSR